MGKYSVKEAKTGPMFNLKAGNGEIILTSEVYSGKSACLNGIESVKNNAPIANVEDQTVEGFAKQKCPKFELYKDKKGEFRFRLNASNGQTVGVSEGYASKSGALNGIESVKKNSGSETVFE